MLYTTGICRSNNIYREEIGEETQNKRRQPFLLDIKENPYISQWNMYVTPPNCPCGVISHYYYICQICPKPNFREAAQPLKQVTNLLQERWGN